MTANPDQTTSLPLQPGVVIDAGVPHARAMRELLGCLSAEEKAALAAAFEANPDAFNPFALSARNAKHKATRSGQRAKSSLQTSRQETL